MKNVTVKAMSKEKAKDRVIRAPKSRMKKRVKKKKFKNRSDDREFT